MTEEDWKAFRGGTITLLATREDGASTSYKATIEDVRCYPHCIHLQLGLSLTPNSNEWKRDPDLSWELVQPIDYDQHTIGDNVVMFESAALQQVVVLLKAA